MYKAKLFKILMLSILIFLCCVPFSYGASVPQLINYQGTLTNASGTPVPDGQYSVVFSIYDISTGGTALWTETWNLSTAPVSTIGGNFNVMLGAHNPIPASFFADHPVTYLGIRVGNDSEMLPRQRIASVAYAFTAGSGSIPQGGIIMWSGSVDQIPEGWALCDGNNGTPDLRDRFIVGVGSSYPMGATGGVATNNISHTHTISPDGAHTHTYSGTTGVNNDTEPAGGGSGSTVADSSHYHNYSGTTSSNGTHSHGGVTSTGGSASLENRPPYYALVFIMKL